MIESVELVMAALSAGAAAGVKPYAATTRTWTSNWLTRPPTARNSGRP
jgi:hypothetical protein